MKIYGFTRSSRKFEFSHMRKRKPNSDVNQTLPNERNRIKKCNSDIKHSVIVVNDEISEIYYEKYS